MGCFMSNDGKKTRLLPWIMGLTFVAITALFFFMFCREKFTHEDAGKAYVFDGWVYGREDQKKACAALVAAGLNDFSWESGKLCVAASNKSAYQSALAGAGAYPKAPSESRSDALRDMSPFESDSKSKMRELNACALQLERTIEQMRGVEYATVGVRSRREQVGLTAKNIVTASIGVAYEDDACLDLGAVSAITAAAKRQLGIDDDSNVVILDLKEGVSYLGSEENNGAPSDAALNAERNLIEKYWRNKYIDAFADVRNIRVSVDVDLVDLGCLESRFSGETDVSSFGKLRSTNEIDEFVSTSENDRSHNVRRIVQVAALQHADIDRKNVSVTYGGRAELGNPCSKQSVRNRQTGTFNERRIDVRKPRVLAEAVGISGPVASDLKNVALWNYHSIGNALENVGSVFEDYAPRLITTSLQRTKGDEKFCKSADLENRSIGQERNEAYRSTKSPVRLANVVSAAAEQDRDDLVSAKYRVRSISFHIGVPRSYILDAVQQARLSNFSPKETFAGNSGQNENLFELVQEQLLIDTKNYAVSLFRPTAERMGWNEEETTRCFHVEVFSDVDSIGKNVAEACESRSVAKFGGFEANGEPSDLGDGYLDENQENFEKNDWKPLYDDESADTQTSSEIVGQSGVVANTSGKIADISTTDFLEENEDVDEESKQNEHEGLTLADFSSANFWTHGSPSQKALGVLLIVLCLLSLLVLLGRCSGGAEQDSRDVVHQEDSVSKPQDKRVFASKRRDTASTPCERVNVLQSQISQTNAGYYSELDDEEFDDDLEKELAEFTASNGVSSRSLDERVNEMRPVEIKDADSVDFSTDRQEALDLISRYPKRAADSLQAWVKGSEA